MMEENNNKIIKVDATETTNDDDRISQLPECLVHHILSFLDSSVQLVRMSVLSKRWFSLAASFPILVFYIGKFVEEIQPYRTGKYFDICEDEFRDLRDKFSKYVEYTTSRFCDQNVSAQTFKLYAMIQEPEKVDIFDRCIGLILKKGVQVLEISNILNRNQNKPMPTYRLPNILLSASSLTSLAIRNCKLPSSLIGDAVKFKSLKVLRLDTVSIDEEMIKRLITSCPLLEDINLESCSGFNRFCIYGHQNLQAIQIKGCTRMERIDIEAPNLCYLYLFDLKRISAPCMNVASCEKLTTLVYVGNLSPSFADFSSNFPFLKHLYMNLPNECNKLKLSSRSLTTLGLWTEYDLEGIDIDTPKLHFFEYDSSGLRIPGPCKKDSAYPKAQMNFYLNDKLVDSLWFHKLRRFVDKKNGFKDLKLCIHTNFRDVDELKQIQSPPPYELQHVELLLSHGKGSSVYVAVVDAVLWCFCPRSLTLTFLFFTDFEEWIHVVKFTFEKLVQQEGEGLNNIQIVLPSSSKASKHFSDLNSLLAALPHDLKEHKITFIKE